MEYRIVRGILNYQVYRESAQAAAFSNAGF